MWYGGSSPHQPFQDPSPQSPPPIGPNILRPMITAPQPPRELLGDLVAGVVLSALSPWASRQAAGLEHPLVQLLAARAERLLLALVGPAL